MEVGAAEDTAFAVESVAEKLAELVNTAAAAADTDSDSDCDDHLCQNYFWVMTSVSPSEEVGEVVEGLQYCLEHEYQ